MYWFYTVSREKCVALAPRPRVRAPAFLSLEARRNSSPSSTKVPQEDVFIMFGCVEAENALGYFVVVSAFRLKIAALLAGRRQMFFFSKS